jgi:Chaperone of endosialidase
MAGGFRGPNPNLQETTAMKTAITSKITLLNILRSRSTLILIALGFMVFVLAQRTQAVNPPPDGDNADFGNTTASNVIVIGTNVSGQNANNSCFMGEIFGATSSNGTAVFINSDGRLGTTSSSWRVKEAIEPMDQASEILFALKPVRFHYRREIDPTGTSQFGLVAEDVAKVDPALIVRDKEGKPYSVSYDQVNALLLNEFLKEPKKAEGQRGRIEKQEATITELKSNLAAQTMQIQALMAGLQKVSAQVELSAVDANVIATSQRTVKRRNNKHQSLD